MIEAEQYPVQMMEEKELSDYHTENILQLARSLDALRVNSRQDGKNINKALYVALAINWEGRKEVLGLWLANTEGAKFWMSVLTDIKNRGVEDILIACMDGLTGFPDDDSIYKVMYLAIKNASIRWTMSIKDWGLAVNQFAILFDGRVPGFN